jgi:multidrug resistance efflux pump
MVSGVTRALVILNSPTANGYQPVAVWPETAFDHASLEAVGQRAISEHRRILQHSPLDSGSSQIVACPVFVQEQLVGAFCVELANREERQQQAALQVLAWGTAWLQMLLHNLAESAGKRLDTVTRLLSRVLEQDTLEACAKTGADVLASRLPCERVTIGLVQGGDLRIIAMSPDLEINQKASLVRMLIAAMQEAFDQQRVISIPDGINLDATIVREHLALSRALQGSHLCSVPLTDRGRCVGTLLLERQPKQAFDSDTQTLCSALGAILGGILHQRRLHDRAWTSRLWAAGLEKPKRILGPDRMRLKAGLAACVALLAGASLIEHDYRVEAKANLRGTVQRAVVTPFDGFLAEATVRAGDLVEEGQLLCSMDDRDLVLERAKWVSEQKQIEKVQREALARHNRSESAIQRARLAQADAELALVEEKLAKTRLRAPLAGVVVSGDLSQSLGMPLERGQLLFEIAPLDAYSVILDLDERDIAHVRPGQRGTLILSGLPHERLAFSVERLLPIANAADGVNRFQIEARLDQKIELLRPGMRGVAKVNTGSRTLIWILTHKVTDVLQLYAWSWLG